ncbi:MAG TPA: glutaredoxin domain-containing protein [Actinomycetota bacterium]|jgi:mycoredoxin|nr:glutaredoxin domain-containing protein [Actinomycetota bacterium]
MSSGVVVYGADWCGDCVRAKRLLDARGTSYEWIDVEVQAGAAQEAVRLAGGRRNIPVIVMPGGSVLVEPTDPELEKALART